MENKPASIAAVYNFFAARNGGKATTEDKAAYPLARFRTEWSSLSAESKAQLATGIGDGSFSY